MNGLNKELPGERRPPGQTSTRLDNWTCETKSTLMKHKNINTFINALWGSGYVDEACLGVATLMNMSKSVVVINVMCPNHMVSMVSGAQSTLMNDLKFESFINALFWLCIRSVVFKTSIR